MRKCDLCNRQAVVYETTFKNGVLKEVNLCKDHAAEAGISIPASSAPPLNQMLTHVVVSKPAAPSARAARKSCPACGYTFAQLRQKGIVGCPTCYEAFERHLVPLIERAHNGGTSHVGKTPARAAVSIDRQQQIQQLMRELDHAVAAEQYERAADLRDRIGSLKGPEADPSRGEA
jgi:protein arginine kinase activator